VDHDPDQEPHDLGAPLVGESGVQAGPHLGEEVMDLLGHDLATWSL
jgi:hypothetical protein